MSRVLSLSSLLFSCALVQASQDVASLLQQPPVPKPSDAVQEAPKKSRPLIIDLRRESVPVYRRGKIASFKTSYSGVLNVGTPAQEFRVVFDTGSGNIVLPAAECKTEACLMPDRRRFNMSASSTSAPVNSDGSVVPEGEACDQVTIGFGTGEITGEFTTDTVCFGVPPKPPSLEEADSSEEEILTDDNPVSLQESHSPAVKGDAEFETQLCVEMSVVLAVEMSTQPFKTFRFDGILGLGLDGLAMNKQFSAFEMIMGTGLPASHFGVFLSEGEDGEEESQIAMGGVDHRRLLEPLSWAPVQMPELGYWQVPIKAVRVGGKLLDVCLDGTCRGVVDTGTSHLGIPAPYDKEMSELLVREAGDVLDCRLIDAPEIEIELPGYTITLHPANYMRRLPLREGVSVSSAQGVYVPANDTNKTLAAPSSSDPVGQKSVANFSGLQTNHSKNASAATSVPSDQAADSEGPVRRFCSPRLMPVRLPEPLGPKLFILGEPVLHRYYTVYDWGNRSVGFGLANNHRNTMDPSQIVDRRGVLPKEVEMLLMQERVTVRRGRDSSAAELQEEVAMVQVTVKLSLRKRARRM